MEAIEIIISLSGVLLATLIFFIIRNTVLISSIKQNSTLFAALQNLNAEYAPLFLKLDKTIKIPFPCTKPKTFHNNNNKNSIFDYTCGFFINNKAAQRTLYSRQSNKANLSTYLTRYNKIEAALGGKSYAKVKPKSLLTSELQYKRAEQKFCRRKQLKPDLKLNIAVRLSYSSPAGRRQYVSTYKMSGPTIDNILAQIEGKRRYELHKKHQRALITKAVRFEILKRDGYVCQICGASRAEGARLEVDHKLAVANWGTNTNNLWTLCHDCNNGKGSKEL
ncbi:HNH endonuclease [Candidatus Saccharibacteria bacterium]|nr:HNH endonuclease [Candidatus Saccharibacteria bacterium]